MAGLEFKLQRVSRNGEAAPGKDAAPVGFRSLVRVITACEKMISQVDRDLAGTNSALREWIVSDTQIGSFTLELDPPPLPAELGVGTDTATTLVKGIDYLEREQRVPLELREGALRRLQAVAGSLRSGDDEYEVLITSKATDDTARISHPMAKQINQLLQKERISVGSIEGKLELISVHEGSRKFNVYHDVTGRAVQCDLPRDLERQVVEALGNRVIVSGAIHRNLNGTPVRVRVEGLRVLPVRSEEPTIDELMGSIPDLTGDLSTEEFVRMIRDESASR